MFMLGILIIVLITHYVGLREVINDVKKLDARGFLILLSIQVTMMFLWACKWRIVLRHFDVSFKNVLPVNMIGYMMNNMTPLGMAGGETTKAYLLSKIDNISAERSMASVIVDLFLDIFPLIFMVLVSVFLVFLYDVPLEFAVVLVIAAAILLVAALAIAALPLNKEFAMRILHFILRFAARIPFLKKRAHAMTKRVDEIIENFQSAMHKTATDRVILSSGILLSSTIFGLGLLRTYIVFGLLGIDIDIPILIIVQVSVGILSFVPILPGAIGLWEGLSVALYSLVGIPAPSAMAVTIIDRFFSFWVGSFIGLIATTYMGLNFVLTYNKEQKGGLGTRRKRS